MNTKNQGVYITRKKDNSIYFRSSITYHSKHISLGSFDVISDAQTAFSEAHEILSNSGIVPSCYEDKSFVLSYNKFISLINYRDNGIYFCNPIYVRPKFFYYYYSPSVILKFDSDDLFYYSSHKIMMRNHHLFVSDYGMQVTIRNRYGIMNYAVEGRDYIFQNHDRYDFRSSNIKILNRYIGVTKTERKGKIKYCARILINGSYIVGYYETAIEAAVAYNKACDTLIRNGCKKKFRQNETEGLSPSAYASMYLDLDISCKIEQLHFNTHESSSFC